MLYGLWWSVPDAFDLQEKDGYGDSHGSHKNARRIIRDHAKNVCIVIKLVADEQKSNPFLNKREYYSVNYTLYTELH